MLPAVLSFSGYHAIAIIRMRKSQFVSFEICEESFTASCVDIPKLSETKYETAILPSKKAKRIKMMFKSSYANSEASFLLFGFFFSCGQKGL